MSKRIELQRELEALIGSRNVYFQPPATIKMAYPCIVYELSRIDVRYADDRPYSWQKGYTVTIIDKNPDSELPDKLLEMPSCRFDRHFTGDNLHHFVFTLYY